MKPLFVGLAFVLSALVSELVTADDVSPATFNWQIGSLRAEVRQRGRINVKGRGVVLTGGNGIRATSEQRVFATLFCGPRANSSSHNSNIAGVPVQPNGDFHIDDALTPAPPDPCATPVLLIVSATDGHWFAAGFSKIDEQ